MSADAPTYSAARAWWVVAVMFFASIVSVIDRGILTLVVDPLRRDLGVSEVQVSLLIGLSFGLFYAVVGLPLGLAADRLRRRPLLALGVAGWSVATLAGGIAQSFGQIFAARLLVGLGEATLAPCAVSLIADMFPANKRGLPVSVYLLGQSLAGGLSLAVTGMVLEAVPAGTLDWLPFVAGAAPWRVAFVLAGLTGLPVVLMLLTFREPPRRDASGAPRPRLADVVRHLLSRWRVFVPFYAGFAAVVVLAYGINAWGATFIMRRFALSAGELGKAQGMASMVLGVIGALSAGAIVNAVSARLPGEAKLLYLALVAALMVPIAGIGFAPSAPVAIAMVAMTSLLLPMIGTGMITTLQDLLPGTMHGVGVSLFGLFNTISGQVLAPWLIALVASGNPAAGGGGEALGHALLLTCGPAILVAILLYLGCYAALRRGAGGPAAAYPST